jgi:hypothetical protein
MLQFIDCSRCTDSLWANNRHRLIKLSSSINLLWVLIQMIQIKESQWIWGGYRRLNLLLLIGGTAILLFLFFIICIQSLMQFLLTDLTTISNWLCGFWASCSVTTFLILPANINWLCGNESHISPIFTIRYSF